MRHRVGSQTVLYLGLGLVILGAIVASPFIAIGGLVVMAVVVGVTWRR